LFVHAWTGGYPKTHDFLQPLERIGRSSAKEETISTVEKPAPPAAPPSAEHILPGGIGTYSISHISYFAQRAPKPEVSIFTAAQTSSTDRNDENSNCSSYTGSGFTLWEESAAALKKGKTRKENMGEKPIVRGKCRVNCLYSIYIHPLVPLFSKVFACSCKTTCPWKNWAISTSRAIIVGNITHDGLDIEKNPFFFFFWRKEETMMKPFTSK